jgi:DNA invertase Pin-like site-specific DNA recombinase
LLALASPLDYKGRHPSARSKAAEVIVLAADGMKREDIAIQLEISIASVYRILAASKAKPVATQNNSKFMSATCCEKPG